MLVVGILIGGLGWPAIKIEEPLHANDIETQLAFEKFLSRQDIVVRALAYKNVPLKTGGRMRGGFDYSYGEKLRFRSVEEFTRGLPDEEDTIFGYAYGKLQGVYIDVYARDLGDNLNQVVWFWLPLHQLPKIKTSQGMLKTLAIHGVAYNIMGNMIWFPEYVPREGRLP